MRQGSGGDDLVVTYFHAFLRSLSYACHHIYISELSHIICKLFMGKGMEIGN